VPLDNPPSAAAVAQVFPNAAGPAASPFAEFYLNPDGTLFRQAGATGYTGPVGPGTPFKINEYTGALQDVYRVGYASSPLTRYSAFGRATYDIADNLTLFTQANFASWKVDQILDYSPGVEFWSAPVPRDAEHPVRSEERRVGKERSCRG